MSSKQMFISSIHPVTIVALDHSRTILDISLDHGTVIYSEQWVKILSIQPLCPSLKRAFHL